MIETFFKHRCSCSLYVGHIKIICAGPSFWCIDYFSILLYVNFKLKKKQLRNVFCEKKTIYNVTFKSILDQTLRYIV